MTSRIPQRDYLTFTELVKQLPISEDNLRYAIISGALKPCVRLNGSYSVLEWDEDPVEGWSTSPLCQPSEEQSEYKVTANDWFYLQDPMQTEAFECKFYYASESRDPKKSNSSFDIWHSLADHMTLKDVEERAVFLSVEVKKYEVDYLALSGTTGTSPAEKPLGNRERETLLKLVIGMAIRGYGYDPEALKSTALKEIVDDLADLGVNVGVDRVRHYLKEAANTVLSAKPRQP